MTKVKSVIQVNSMDVIMNDEKHELSKLDTWALLWR